jgi:pimeloyl-ACP methyl ester carboxylesterase
MVDVGPWVDFGATTGMRGFMSEPIAHLTVEELVDKALAISASGGRDKILYRYLHMTHRLADGALAWRDDRGRTKDYPHMLAKLDELADLAPGMTCHALIVRGGRSKVLTAEKVERFAALFRDGRAALIEGAGHNVQEDRPKELAAILRAFLKPAPA